MMTAVHGAGVLAGVLGVALQGLPKDARGRRSLGWSGMRRSMQAFGEAWTRCGRIYGSERPARRFKQKVRWSVVAAAWQGEALHWFERCDSGELRPYAEADPLLAFRPMRAYLHAGWGRARRARMLGDAYAFATHRGGALQRALLDPDGIRLAALPGGAYGPMELWLGREYRHRKEGEWTLSLRMPGQRESVMTSAFCLGHDREGRWTLFIGAVQGRGEASEIIRALTKSLHGLRPKALLGLTLHAIGKAVGARIVGAGNAIQVHRKKHAIHVPFLHRLNFDYDALWGELGGRPVEEGWFELPHELPRRDREAIKPNKRTQYARRYAMLEALEAEIAQAM